ncbi:MAG: VWA domain-containing protein [Firmicutes bacterium]|nr:VWA domain-containing protein [Bacillota bacterium]
MKKSRFFLNFLISVLLITFKFYYIKAEETLERSKTEETLETCEKLPNELTKKTNLVLVIDKSGSMLKLTDDTIKNVNSIISEQKSIKSGEVYVTTVMFNDGRSVVHSNKKLDEVESITKNNYEAEGCTALFDAVGNTIAELSSFLEKEDKNNKSKVVFIIITDGLENCSKEFNKEKILKIISDKKNNDKWEFVFLGANIDSASVADEMGIDKEYARDFKADSDGIKKACKLASLAVTQVRNDKNIYLGDA